MKSLASLVALIALATPAAAQEPPPGDGPRGSSQPGPGETRFDAVGRAAIFAAPGHAAAATGLAEGGIAEVTALDTGKTILVSTVAGTGAGFAVSAAAAAGLGITDGAAIRIRRVVASPQDASLLARGLAASSRIDAPPAVLTALRKQLDADMKVAAKPAAKTSPRKPVAAKQPAAPAAKPVAKPAMQRPGVAGGYAVQVGSFSSLDRAKALAGRVGGTVTSTAGVHRVRIGPFTTRTAAEGARARANSLGSPGANIIRTD